MEEKNSAPELRPEAEASGSRRPFPTIGDLLAMLGIVLGMQLVVGATSLVVGLFLDVPPAEMAPRQQGAFLALSYVASMLPAWLLVLCYRRARGGRGSAGRFSRKGLNPVLLAWAFVFMLAVSVVCEPLFALLPAPATPDLGRGIWTLLSVVVAAPVLEELLCRGVVLEAVRSRYGTVSAWLLSSLFFGVLHVDATLVLNAFVIGLILGYIYIATESLWASMVLHALNNAAAYALLAAGRSDMLLFEAVGSRTLYALLYIGALAVTVVSARMVWRTLRRPATGAEKEPGAQ